MVPESWKEEMCLELGSHNGATWRSLDIWSYVRLADGAENEVSAFCFTFNDPATRQPGEPKMSSEIATMLANVRPNCAQVGVSGSFILRMFLSNERPRLQIYTGLKFPA